MPTPAALESARGPEERPPAASASPSDGPGAGPWGRPLISRDAERTLVYRMRTMREMSMSVALLPPSVPPAREARAALTAAPFTQEDVIRAADCCAACAGWLAGRDGPGRAAVADTILLFHALEHAVQRAAAVLGAPTLLRELRRRLEGNFALFLDSVLTYSHVATSSRLLRKGRHRRRPEERRGSLPAERRLSDPVSILSTSSLSASPSSSRRGSLCSDAGFSVGADGEASLEAGIDGGPEADTESADGSVCSGSAGHPHRPEIRLSRRGSSEADVESRTPSPLARRLYGGSLAEASEDHASAASAASAASTPSAATSVPRSASAAPTAQSPPIPEPTDAPDPTFSVHIFQVMSSYAACYAHILRPAECPELAFLRGSLHLTGLSVSRVNLMALERCHRVMAPIWELLFFTPDGDPAQDLGVEQLDRPTPSAPLQAVGMLHSLVSSPNQYMRLFRGACDADPEALERWEAHLLRLASHCARNASLLHITELAEELALGERLYASWEMMGVVTPRLSSPPMLLMSCMSFPASFSTHIVFQPRPENADPPSGAGEYMGRQLQAFLSFGLEAARHVLGLWYRHQGDFLDFRESPGVSGASGPPDFVTMPLDKLIFCLVERRPWSAARDGEDALIPAKKLLEFYRELGHPVIAGPSGSAP